MLRVNVALTVVELPALMAGVATPCCRLSDGLLEVGLVFTRIVVVVAPALPLPWLATVTVTVTEPPAVTEVLLKAMFVGVRSGLEPAETAIAAEWAASLLMLLWLRTL
jgi:hypothetical protein